MLEAKLSEMKDLKEGKQMKNRIDGLCYCLYAAVLESSAEETKSYGCTTLEITSDASVMYFRASYG